MSIDWKYRDACDAVDMRDRDRSAISDVPKSSGLAGQYSHHHRLLRSRGGTDSPANLLLLLGSGTTSEHGWVHRYPAIATVLGLVVATGGDPQTVPVWRVDAFGMSHGWHLQLDDGTLQPTTPPTEYSPTALRSAITEYDRLMRDSRLTAIAHL